MSKAPHVTAQQLADAGKRMNLLDKGTAARDEASDVFIALFERASLWVRLTSASRILRWRVARSRP